MFDKERIEELLQALTLEEKIGMIHGNGLFRTEGVPRLGIPPFKMSDGPMGVRHEFENDTWRTLGYSDDYVTYLPSNSALAATWNRQLAYEIGRVLGEETRGRGKDMILAPGINIKRSPLCGRSFEYMSEDPYHIEELAVPLIKGIQESDVAACVKHFAANNQETERLWVEAIIDDAALYEIYLPGFKAAVKQGQTYGIMGAYNQLRGEHCCQSEFLLNDILRKEWGYEGIVVSDWGGVHDTDCATKSSLDIEMSVTNDFDDYFMARPLLEAVRKGEISETLIDEKVRHILNVMMKLNMLGEGRKTGGYNTPKHRQVALEGARESVVLLKNEADRLPLNPKKLKKLLVIGSNADRKHANGGGSAEIKALYEITPLMGLKSKLGGNVEIIFAEGYDDQQKALESEVNWQESSLSTESVESLEEDHTSGPEVYGEGEKTQAEDIKENGEVACAKKQMAKRAKVLLEEAVQLASQIEDVIIIGGLNHDYDTEGGDRKDMKLPYGQDELIEAVLAVNPNAVIAMVAGSPVDMGRWAYKAKAIVWSWYAGMEGGNALAEVLLGVTNPSGKLPETFPVKCEDCPAHAVGEFPGGKEVHYTEGIFVGYRYYDTEQIEPLFCFGHGISYTTFVYDDLHIQVEENEWETKVMIDCRITNTGKVEGAETIQLYIKDKVCSIKRPEQVLKGFEKVTLQPGESTRVYFILNQEAFSFYDQEAGRFKVEPGTFEIRLGSSSREIRLKQLMRLNN